MPQAGSPLTIGKHTLKNRIAFAPTVKFDWTDGSGIPTERFARHYGARAAGGAGLIVVEATCVTPSGRLAMSQLGLWDDAQIPGHRAITDACRQHDSVVLVQLHHGGPGTNPEAGPSVGPSQAEWRRGTVQEMTVDEIHTVRRQFIDAALRAKAAGYDGVQLHACHAYLLNAFVSPDYNFRTDEFGGSTDNRVRLSCEIIRGIREACGGDFLISARTPGAEPTLEEGCAIAGRYIDAGADLLQVSSGIGKEQMDYPDGLPYNKICLMGVELHRRLKGRVPVSAVNGILTPELARYLIENGLCDIVDSARALLADPNWANAVTDGGDYVKCFDCKMCQWAPRQVHHCPAVAVRRKADPDCID